MTKNQLIRNLEEEKFDEIVSNITEGGRLEVGEVIYWRDDVLPTIEEYQKCRKYILKFGHLTDVSDNPEGVIAAVKSIELMCGRVTGNISPFAYEMKTHMQETSPFFREYARLKLLQSRAVTLVTKDRERKAAEIRDAEAALEAKRTDQWNTIVAQMTAKYRIENEIPNPIALRNFNPFVINKRFLLVCRIRRHIGGKNRFLGFCQEQYPHMLLIKNSKAPSMDENTIIIGTITGYGFPDILGFDIPVVDVLHFEPMPQ